MQFSWIVTVLVVVSLAQAAGLLRAQPIAVPNGSFESPVTTFVDTRIDAWQKTPKPFWYDESGGNLWDQLIGLFKNTSPESADHIDNMDGDQAIFLFALPEAGLFQDYDSLSGTNPVPTRAFDAQYEAGKAYQLTVALFGGGGGMTNGVNLELSLYYRDAETNLVPVAATNITYTATTATNVSHFTDYTLRTPIVQASNPWAGKHIGIQLLSTVSPDLVGGYWRLDNVRLEALLSGPTLAGSLNTNGQFQLLVRSDPGLKFEILATTNLALPVADWTPVGTYTNIDGALPFVEATTNMNGRFYQARQVP